MGQKGWKKPLSAGNVARVTTHLEELKAYFCSLREPPDGKLMTETNRKTGFLGFVVFMDSIIRMCNLGDNQLFVYLPTSKLSQDHLELFFGVIRSFGHCNDNPTAKQFEAAFKRFIVHSEC